GENMKICQILQSEENKDVKFALATVVHVSGSAYKKEGAKMIVDENGHMTGMISGGGCLEPDVAEIAKQVIATERLVLKHYNMDEDLILGLGLGCPGTVDIFIEPVYFSRRKDDPLYGWIKSVNEEKASILCKVIDTSLDLEKEIGKHLLLDENFSKTSNL